MIKLIASDMDGTLLDDKGNLNEEFFEILEELFKRNIKFAVASGRQYFALLKSFDRVKDKLVYIAENGTLVKYNNEELHVDALSSDDILRVIKFCEGIKGLHLVFCGKECAYINTNEKSALEEIQKYYYKFKVIDNFSNIKDEILKISIMDIKGPETNCYEDFNREFKDTLQVVISGKIWLDLYNKGTNKGTALRLIQEKFDIKKEETMVFGDYFNDIDMFKEAHYSYAMENAPEEVKKHASFIAKSNIENGVLEVLKDLIK